MTHSTYVQRIAGGKFFATCRQCGSDAFPDRATLVQAEADARAHGDLNHVYPRDQLVAWEGRGDG